MADLFDTREIPDDPQYWDALAARVAARSARPVEGSVVDWFAHSRASWIAASVLLAAGLTFMILPDSDAEASSVDPGWASAVAPTDDVGRAIAAGDAPPSIGALLFTGSGGVR